MLNSCGTGHKKFARNIGEVNQLLNIGLILMYKPIGATVLLSSVIASCFFVQQAQQNSVDHEFTKNWRRCTKDTQHWLVQITSSQTGNNCRLHRNTTRSCINGGCLCDYCSPGCNKRANILCSVLLTFNTSATQTSCVPVSSPVHLFIGVVYDYSDNQGSEPMSHGSTHFHNGSEYQKLQRVLYDIKQCNCYVNLDW